MIADSEAAPLADSIAGILDEYAISTSRRAMLWIDLAMVSGMIYGPRVALINRKRREAVRQRSAVVPPMEGTPPVAAPSGKIRFQ